MIEVLAVSRRGHEAARDRNVDPCEDRARWQKGLNGVSPSSVAYLTLLSGPLSGPKNASELPLLQRSSGAKEA